MIKQCAIEPDVIRNWDRLRIFAGECGISKGRVIARFPEDWLDVVDAGMTKPEDQNVLKLVNETLDRLKKNPAQYFASRERASYLQSDWLENAIVEHERRRFDAIVAERNPREDQRVMRADEVHAKEPRWKTETCKTFKRDAAGFVDVAAPLLSLSRQIVLVDRYLQPGRLRTGHRDVLRAVAQQLSPEKTERFEYHFCDEPDESEKPIPWIEGDIRSRIKLLLPKGIKLALIEWPRGSFHDRFMLTERGGIKFGNSLSSYGEPDDEAMLLSDDGHDLRWEKFSMLRKPKLEIVGQRQVQ